MTQAELRNFVEAAETIYEARLEPEHQGEFVATQPETGDYFLGKTVGEAIGAARRAHPGRLAQAIRIGHPAAVQIGIHLTRRVRGYKGETCNRLQPQNPNPDASARFRG
jgi:hypothetical protein